ncbi:hypothetical protein BDB00DRAFT_879923, partial [Zychaea mexicana]|uniref:uncharacterized protein n=1 Tax=Zychaea mexicana TaxID=64656 RepID=UPI0022FDE60E
MDYYQEIRIYTQDGKPTSFNALREVMQVASTAVGDEPRLPRILWVPDTNYRELVVANTSNKISINHFQICVELCMNEIEAVLNSADFSFGMHNVKDLVLGLCQGDTNNICDNMGLADVGYSYIMNGRNQFGSVRYALVIALLRNGNWRSQYVEAIDRAGTILWNKAAIFAWLEKCVYIQKLLIVAMHLSYGQPCRGEELAQLCITNTQYGDRSLFWGVAYNTIMVITRYNKSRELTCSDKYIARYLPHKLAVLLTGYLAYFRPLECIFTGHLYGPEARLTCMERLFVENGTAMTGKKVRRIFAWIYAKKMDPPLSFSDHRHVSIAFARQLIGAKKTLQHVDEEDLEDWPEELDLQAGHSTATAGLEYARSNIDSRFLDPITAQKYFDMSRRWHTLLGIEKKQISNTSGDPLLERRKREIKNVNKLIEENAAYIEARNHALMRNMILEDMHRRARNAIVNGGPAIPIIKEGANRSLAACQGSAPDVTNMSSEAKALRGLRLLLQEPSATFQSKIQQEATIAAIERKKNILVVLPTGGGKSAVFMAPSLIEKDKTTIVVVPLVTLLGDMARRLVDSGIDYCTYDGTLDHGMMLSVKIILVTPEKAKEQKFVSMLHTMSAQGRISRIIIDEAHLVITWSSFRPTMGELAQLRTVPVPMVFLSATLPPPWESDLSVLFKTEFQVFRSLTVRPNLRYVVHTIKNKGSNFKDVKAYIVSRLKQAITDELTGGGCAIVYSAE